MPTPRQVAVLEAIVITGDKHGAARRLGLSYWTVKHHVQDMRDRTGYRVEQLVAIGLRDGWLVVRDPIERGADIVQ